MISPIVPVSWLEANRSAVVLADVRWALGGPPGREAYESGHVPGAVFVDLDTQLAAPASATDGRHPLPSPEAFAGAMSELGIGDDSVVVAYDDSKGSSAARLVWMLRVLGRQAALLDGGLGAWTGALETGSFASTARSFTVQPWPTDRVVDADLVASLASTPVAVLDARDHGRFTGEKPAPVDVRAGHAPGAVSAPWQDNLGDDGLFRSPDELRVHYAALGAVPADRSEPGEPPVVYCGSGVTACLDLLALERAGVEGARLYPGSWSQWAADASRPVANGG